MDASQRARALRLIDERTRTFHDLEDYEAWMSMAESFIRELAAEPERSVSEKAREWRDVLMAHHQCGATYRDADFTGALSKRTERALRELAAEPERVPLTNEVIRFLLGEAPLDGVWFGEQHPTERGQFWWRRRIRKLLDACPQMTDKQVWDSLTEIRAVERAHGITGDAK